MMKIYYHRNVPVVYDLPAYDYLGPRAIKVRVGSTKELASKLIELLSNPEKISTLALEFKQKAFSYKLEDIANMQLEDFKRFIDAGNITDVL